MQMISLHNMSYKDFFSICFVCRYVTTAGDQKAAGSPGSDLIYSKDAKDGVTASFTKDTQETKPGQKRSGPLLMFLNKGKLGFCFVYTDNSHDTGFSERSKIFI